MRKSIKALWQLSAITLAILIPQLCVRGCINYKVSHTTYSTKARDVDYDGILDQVHYNKNNEPFKVTFGLGDGHYISLEEWKRDLELISKERIKNLDVLVESFLERERQKMNENNQDDKK